MKVLEAAENYLETILILQNRNGQVRAIDVVRYLNYSKPTVSIALRNLTQSGHITRDINGHIHLTDRGRAVASEIYARHELLAKLLMKVGVSEETARMDACKIEHDLSAESVAKLRDYLEKSCV